MIVVFPDAVAAVVGYLSEGLAARSRSMPVRAKVPNPRPSPFVLVRRLGGVRRDLVTDEPLIGIEVWASTEAEAHDIAQLCRALLNHMPHDLSSDVVVYQVVELGGLAVLPDPLSDQPRYVFTSTLAIRGRPE